MITAKLKLHPYQEQFQGLRRTQLAYRDALNYVSRYAFAHGKQSKQEAAASEHGSLRVGLCRVTQYDCLQSPDAWIDGHQGRRLLHEQVVSHVRAYCRGQSSQSRLALLLSAVPGIPSMLIWWVLVT
jgi:hypothetical protein